MNKSSIGSRVLLLLLGALVAGALVVACGVKSSGAVDRASVDSIPRWDRKTFFRVSMRESGRYAIDEYEDAHTPSYRINGKELNLDWGQEDVDMIILSSRAIPYGYQLEVTYKEDPNYKETIELFPLDSLGVLWRIHNEARVQGEIFVDSVHMGSLDSMAVRSH